MAIDLHLHTKASDGSFTPAEIVEEAKKVGLTAIGITDHDTMDGVDEALRMGLKLGIEVVPGIELNTDYEDREIHVLGYYLDHTNDEFQRILETLQVARVNRVEKIVEKLNNQGILISIERVKEFAGEGSMGRPHIAQAILEAGYANNWEEIFTSLIGRECPAYVPRTKLTPFSAVELILKVGGVPVLAHPGLNDLDEIIPHLIEMGLMGIEVYHFEHSEEDKIHYLKIAQENGLIITGGSDCHGPGKKSGVRLGRVKLPIELLNDLKEAKKSLTIFQKAVFKEKSSSF
ncbi:MAG: PHP domain-containing protein [Halanaerobiales bacterium]|nr:PHP domain-containing protein [Halanaerobiales bacterium]